MDKNIKPLFTCQCCGYKTLKEEPINTYEICRNCGWQVDDVQQKDPDYVGGANYDSLRECQWDYLGQLEEDCEYEKDKNWEPYERKFDTSKVKVSMIVEKDGTINPIT